ncbi:unnamed protein product [Closterium sp. NIES-65]|nr:unnamed protein product [Closterium sp. NIES-65]
MFLAGHSPLPSPPLPFPSPHSILAAVGGNLTAFSTGRFLLAAGIIAFIFSCSAASKVILPPSPSPLHTHSILVAADGNLTAFSTGRFLLAAGINGILVAAADGNLTAFSSTGQFLLAAHPPFLALLLFLPQPHLLPTQHPGSGGRQPDGDQHGPHPGSSGRQSDGDQHGPVLAGGSPSSLLSPLPFPPFPFPSPAFSILAAADGNLTAFSTGQFLLAAGIIGFIFSFIALVAGIAAVASSSLRDKQSRMYLYFAAESFLNVCLLFGAACTGANVFGESCGFLSNAYDAFESRTNTCTYAKTSVGFAFLASFAFMATHWYYVFAMNRG